MDKKKNCEISTIAFCEISYDMHIHTTGNCNIPAKICKTKTFLISSAFIHLSMLSSEMHILRWHSYHLQWKTLHKEMQCLTGFYLLNAILSLFNSIYIIKKRSSSIVLRVANATNYMITLHFLTIFQQATDNQPLTSYD